MTTPQSRFLRRFDRIWAQARRVQLVQAICWGILAALAGIGIVAGTDYLLELSQSLRTIGLVAVAIASIGVMITLVVRSIRRWRRSATAATIEEVFPQLGQRIRTTVQYGELSSDEIRHQGVATTLVEALEDDTVKAAQPLPLDAVIPWKSLAMASLLAAMLGLALTAASAFDWQWRTAAKRTFLTEEPYTRITVEPGNMSLREGESQPVQIIVEGRIGPTISFWSRRLDEEQANWREEQIPREAAKESPGDHQFSFEVPLDRVKHPLEYRVTAGSTETEVYRVNVLYPLKIVQIQTKIIPPEYTGIGELTIEGGNIAALEGSKAQIQIELDRAPQTAWLELQNVATKRGEVPAEPGKIPLVIEGSRLTAQLVIDRDQSFAVFARDADGMELPENKSRIRARHDEPPQVWFETPSEALEVHTLAEILMRIRASDDFGLARAGIIFEVNNEEEYPLLDEDFQLATAAAEEATREIEKTGSLSPRTRATLERVLPLEHFELTQQDSIMYYAFAEDRRPNNPQRSETDLRFVDIRPFRRQYRVLDTGDGEMPMNQGPQLKSLEELIARQRHALNRSIQTSKKFQRTQQADLAGVDNLIKFEAELAKSTRELAEGLQARGVDDTELLFQAETAMLAAADSLSAGSYDTATLQMRDALKYLIEGRDRIRIEIMKNRNRQQLAQLRAFDRTQRQKLRRPKSDEEEARQIAERLKELADREEMLATMLAAATGGKSQVPMDSTSSSEGQGASDAPMKAEETNSNEEPDSEQNDDSASEKQADGDREIASLQEIEDKQLDVALEAREIETAIGKLPKATDLTKERIAGAAKLAEVAASALGRGANKDAEESIGQAGGQFRELSEQVRALVAEEEADRIAAAQQMAAELARRQDGFRDRLSNPGEAGGIGKPRKEDENKPGIDEENKQAGEQEPMPGLGAEAQEIAEKAKTLADVLGAAGKSEAPEDATAAEKVQAVVGSLDLMSVIDRLQKLPEQVASGQDENAKANAGDGAERMEAAAEQLSALYRVIVAPQIDSLAKFEERLTVLTEELDQLDAEAKVAGWHQDANDLLDDLDKLGMEDKLRQDFVEEMRKSGWGAPELRDKAGWIRTDGYYRAPAPYRVHLSRLRSAVQGRMQELMLGELASAGDEPIPPQYQDFVDRYYQVLTTSGRGTGDVRKTVSPPSDR